MSDNLTKCNQDSCTEYAIPPGSKYEARRGRVRALRHLRLASFARLRRRRARSVRQGLPPGLRASSSGKWLTAYICLRRRRNPADSLSPSLALSRRVRDRPRALHIDVWCAQRKDERGLEREEAAWAC